MELQLHGGEAYAEHEIWDQAGDTSGILSRGPQADSLLGVQQLGGGRDCGSRQGRYIHIRVASGIGYRFLNTALKRTLCGYENDELIQVNTFVVIMCILNLFLSEL